MRIFQKSFAPFGATIIFAVAVGFVMASWTGANDPSRGKALYDAHCSACHGENGDGNGPDTARLSSRPTDFTSASDMAAVTHEVNEQVVAQGKPGTDMPGFGMVLSAEEMADLIVYQRAFLK